MLTMMMTLTLRCRLSTPLKLNSSSLVHPKNNKKTRGSKDCHQKG